MTFVKRGTKRRSHPLREVKRNSVMTSSSATAAEASATQFPSEDAPSRANAYTPEGCDEDSSGGMSQDVGTVPQETPVDATLPKITKASYWRPWLAACILCLPYGFNRVQDKMISKIPSMDLIFTETWLTYVTIFSFFALHAYVLQKFSRKLYMTIICLAICIRALVIVYMNSQLLLYIDEIFRTFIATSANMIFSIYISEIAQGDMKGSLIASMSLFQSVTDISTLIFLKAIPKEYSDFNPLTSKVWFLVIVFFITLFGLVLFLCLLPESPVYLLRRQDREGALRSLIRLRGNTPNNHHEIENTMTLLEVTHSNVGTRKFMCHVFFRWRTLKYSGIVVMLGLLKQCSGYYHADFINAVILQKNDNWFSSFLIACLVHGTGGVIAILVGSRIDRRHILFISTVGCTISVSFLAPLAYHTSMYALSRIHRHIIPLLLSVVHIVFYDIGIRYLYILVATDMFNPKLLSSQLAIVEAMNVLMGDVQYYIREDISDTGTLLVMSAVCAVITIIFYKILPETNLKSKTNLPVDNDLEESRDEEYQRQQSISAVA